MFKSITLRTVYLTFAFLNFTLQLSNDKLEG